MEAEESMRLNGRRFGVVPYRAVFCTLSLLPLQLFGQARTGVYDTADRPTALAKVGDPWHSPVYTRNAIGKALLAENIPVTIVESPEAITAESLAHYDLFILYGSTKRRGGDKGNWMTPEQ